MILLPVNEDGIPVSIPRESGDDPGDETRTFKVNGYSPRERG